MTRRPIRRSSGNGGGRTLPATSASPPGRPGPMCSTWTSARTAPGSRHSTGSSAPGWPRGTRPWSGHPAPGFTCTTAAPASATGRYTASTSTSGRTAAMSSPRPARPRAATTSSSSTGSARTGPSTGMRSRGCSTLSRFASSVSWRRAGAGRPARAARATRDASSASASSSPSARRATGTSLSSGEPSSWPCAGSSTTPQWSRWSTPR